MPVACDKSLSAAARAGAFNKSPKAISIHSFVRQAAESVFLKVVAVVISINSSHYGFSLLSNELVRIISDCGRPPSLRRRA